MRLEPGRRVLWRGPGELQLGSDPETAVRISGLNLAEESLLSRLGDGLTTTELLSRAPAAGVDRTRLHRLLAELGRKGAFRKPQRSPDRRREAVVEVIGLGRTGLALARGLAAARIGTLVLSDSQLVERADVDRGGYQERDIGQVRAGAAARICHDVEMRLQTAVPEGTRPGIVVRVEHDVADPVAARALMADDVDHLSVVVRERDVVVGPFVRPGTSACLRCLDLHRCDEDERWPVIATQLAVRPRRGQQPEDPLLAAVAGAVAAAQVVAAVDRTPLASMGATLEIRVPDGTPARRVWPVHPQCGCTGLPEPPARHPAV